MMVHLKRWYRGRHFSRVVRVTPGMVLGTGGAIYRPCLRAKGSESRGLFFARAQLRRHVANLGGSGRSLLAACDYLARFYSIMNRNGRVIPEAELRELVSCVANHNALFMASGGACAPKHHMLMHPARQMRRNGNMRFGSTYIDEHRNGCFAQICRSAHPAAMATMAIKNDFVWCNVNGQSA